MSGAKYAQIGENIYLEITTKQERTMIAEKVELPTIGRYKQIDDYKQDIARLKEQKEQYHQLAVAEPYGSVKFCAYCDAKCWIDTRIANAQACIDTAGAVGK